MNFEQLKLDIINIYIENELKSTRNIDKHNGTQEDIKQLSLKYGYDGMKEFYMPKYKEGRNGKIDIVWFKDNKPCIAFEVDSSVRSKSIEKLLNFKGEKIWFYYGDRTEKLNKVINKFDKNKEIKLITL